MNKVAKLIVNFSLVAVLVVGLIIGNVIVFHYEQQVNTLLSPPIVDEEALAVTSGSGQEMSARIMEEGAVLLKNNGALPLDYGKLQQVNVFGWRSVDWIYGSEGANASGGVVPEDDDFEKNVDIYKALNAYGVQYNKRLYDMYYDYVQPNHQSTNLRAVAITKLTPLKEPSISDGNYYTESLLEYSKSFSDTAIVVIARMAGEGMDCSRTKQVKSGPGAVDDNTRHYLEISTEEEALLRYCGENFENVVVLLNMSNPFELGFLETIPGIDACLYVGFTGTRGASALPKLLYGEVSPSGKTADIFPYDMFTNPGNVFLNHTYTDYDGDYTDIVENIYVGYKWYETADAEGIWDTVNNEYGTGYDGVVQFPFGHGESYNTYEWTVGNFSVEPGGSIDDKTKIKIDVSVKNTGNYVGRDVVQAYVTVPYYENGIEKSAVSLVAFNKTEKLDPGTSVTVTLEIDPYDFASYDCYDKNNNGFKGYELEEGTYTVKLMTDSHTVKDVTYAKNVVKGEFDFVVDETINIENDPVTGKKVSNLFTGEDAVDTTPLDGNDGNFTADIPWFTRVSFPKPEQFEEFNKARACTPSAKRAFYSADRAAAWNNAAVDEFGDPVSKSSITWGARNGLKLAENGIITALGKKLGADYDDSQWDAVLDQITTAEAVNVINNYYGSKSIDSVGKPYLSDFDGPAQIKGFTTAPRGTGYPTMIVIAQTFNPNLAYDFGKAYGDDMKAVGVMGVWGWAMDNHRSAFFGRNHESPSEDAYLAGSIIANAVRGLNTRGRYCFLKHFGFYGYYLENEHGYLCNWNTEQGFREVNLKAFRMAFVQGGALGAMTSYQGAGAEHSEASVATLTGVLRKEWDFKGAITTDYIGVSMFADSLLRCGGSLAMGVNLSMGPYNESASVRVQGRMREAMHELLYTWLHADYNESVYLANPDTNDTFIASTSINSWSWWQPLVYSIDVFVGVGCALWVALICINVFMKSDKDKEKAQAAAEQ